MFELKYISLYLVFMLGFSWIFSHNKSLAFKSSVLIAILFPIFAIDERWVSWFSFFKVYSVLIGVLLFSWFCYQLTLPKKEQNFTFRYCPQILSIMLFINILEPSILELQHNNILNGVLIGLVALFTPIDIKPNKENSIIGTNKIFWILAYTSTIACMHFFNFHFKDSFFIATCSLIIALIGILITKDIYYWLAYRVYSLFFVVIQFSAFPTTSIFLYFEMFNIEQRALYLDSPSHNLWLALNVILVILMGLERFGKLKYIITKPKNKKLKQ